MFNIFERIMYLYLTILKYLKCSYIINSPYNKMTIKKFQYKLDLYNLKSNEQQK